MEKFLKENFVLKSLSIKDGKCAPSYEYLHAEKEDHSHWVYDAKTKSVPHPDLCLLFDLLKPYLAKDFYIEDDVDTLEMIEVTKVVIVENDSFKGVKILGSISTLHNSRSPLQTGIIKFDSQDTGFEQEIQAIIESIENEAFNFIFKDKNATPNLFSQEVDHEEVQHTLTKVS